MGVTVIALSNRPNEIESAVTNVSKCVSFLSNFKVFVVVFFGGGVVFWLFFVFVAVFVMGLFLSFVVLVVLGGGVGLFCFVLSCFFRLFMPL